MTIMSIRGLSKCFGKGRAATWALRGVDFDVEEGEFVGIMGPSGSGKTTLLNLLSALDIPTSGDVEVNGASLRGLSDKEMAAFRRRSLGFVFQDFNLLNTLTIGENIVLPLALDRVPAGEIDRRLETVSWQLGIETVLDKRTFEVSGGEQQRAAIARAVIHSPAIIMADEPTGNLDSKASAGVMNALSALNQELKSTVLLVTHDPFAASFCGRVLFLKDGRIHSELARNGGRQEFYRDIVSALVSFGGDRDGFAAAAL